MQVWKARWRFGVFLFLKQEKMCDGPDPREILTFIVQSTEKEKKKVLTLGKNL